VKGESDGEVRRVPTPHHTSAQGHYTIVLIHWLQLTEVGLYLIYLRNNKESLLNFIYRRNMIQSTLATSDYTFHQFSTHFL